MYKIKTIGKYLSIEKNNMFDFFIDKKNVISCQKDKEIENKILITYNNNDTYCYSLITETEEEFNDVFNRIIDIISHNNFFLFFKYKIFNKLKNLYNKIRLEKTYSKKTYNNNLKEKALEI